MKTSIRFCSKSPDKGYYAGRKIPVLDLETPEWKVLGFLDVQLAEAIVEGVGGIAVKFKVGIRDVLQKVFKNKLKNLFFFCLCVYGEVIA